MTAPSAARRPEVVAGPSAVPAERRKAALLLHALAPDDRAWLLGELGEAERAALAPLLQELTELGIPADRTLLDEALAGSAASRPPAAVDAEGVPALAAADPAVLAALLRDEPAALVAAFLSVGEWPWREALLRGLGPGKRLEVEVLLSGDGTRAPPGPALRAALVEVVRARLESPAPRARRRGWLQRLLPWRRA